MSSVGDFFDECVPRGSFRFRKNFVLKVMIVNVQTSKNGI